MCKEHKYVKLYQCVECGSYVEPESKCCNEQSTFVGNFCDTCVNYEEECECN